MTATPPTQNESTATRRRASTSSTETSTETGTRSSWARPETAQPTLPPLQRLVPTCLDHLRQRGLIRRQRCWRGACRAQMGPYFPVEVWVAGLLVCWCHRGLYWRGSLELKAEIWSHAHSRAAR